VYLVIEKLRTIILRNFLKKVYLVRFLCLRALPSCCPRDPPSTLTLEDITQMMSTSFLQLKPSLVLRI
jgi:hypothetical protein